MAACTDGWCLWICHPCQLVPSYSISSLYVFKGPLVDRMPTLIYLIGFMGSGKSTLGSILANVLGYDFVDLDDEFVARFDQSIEAFFASEGETAFRRAEALLIEETLDRKDLVVAPGGGAFLVASNRKLMLEHGLVVYLRLSVPVLVGRLRTSRHRPLLFDENGVTLRGRALEERIRQLLAEREAVYEEAHLSIDIDSAPIGEVVDMIAGQLQDFEKKLG